MTSNIRRTFGVSNLSLLGGQSANQTLSLSGEVRVGIGVAARLGTFEIEELVCHATLISPRRLARLCIYKNGAVSSKFLLRSRGQAELLVKFAGIRRKTSACARWRGVA